MTRSEIDALKAEQGKAQAAFDAAQAEAKAAADGGEVISDAVKDRAVAARDELVKYGEQVAAAEKELAKQLGDNSDFLKSLAVELPETTRQYGEPGSPEKRTTEVTRDTVDLFRMRMAEQYGSGYERDNPYAARVNPDSERLTLDMLTTSDNMLPSRAAEFEDRRIKLNANPVIAGTENRGGYTVPDDNSFMNEVQLADLAAGGVANVARVISTPNGRPLPIPTMDDTAATGAQAISENGTAPDVTLTFGEASMGAHMVTSGRLSATVQAIEDAGVTLPQLIGMLAAERIGRREAEYFAAGTGAQQPTGLATAFQVNTGVPVLAFTRASGGSFSTPAAADVWSTFIRIKYAVNAAYRRGPRFSLVMHDRLDQLFAGAAGTDGHPIFRDWGMANTARGTGMAYGGMQVLSDYSITNPYAANGANKATGWIGDFNWFWIRRVAGMVMTRDPYTNAPQFSTNWVFGRRCDSKGLFNTGTNPAVKVIPVTVSS